MILASALLISGAATATTTATATAATAVPEETQSSAEQSAVAEVLVGDWCGGLDSAPEGHWTYSFSRDGKFVARNRQIGVAVGVVATSGHTMQVLFQGRTAPVVSTWQVSPGPTGEILLINDISYVRGACD
ncbi:hypothetical protein [Streptomyces hiroshimensis]|uniref:Secreted protein n=1 Tax=Streptomyces hiroshimensis TaxID=66424 RepID=A0ABQ2YIS3_9ACTN|nr:hypothetical protein [Streptomyces hiroshimensis]GGX85085.1 hypothetical protein GCM10010324_33510 [Streptomyces hiroshimensis]